MYYFAYGSNMDGEQIQERVGDFKVIKTAVLNGYILKFNKQSNDGSGKANIVPDRRSKVEGIVFDLTDKQFKKMDEYEKGYHREGVVLNGRQVKATAYIADAEKINNDLKPKKEYLKQIIDAAVGIKLSENYINNFKKLLLFI